MNNVKRNNSCNCLPLYHKTFPLYSRRLKARKKSLGESRAFTSKELDGETGLYYYGARYLDPRTSRWLSGDPAMGDYIPGAPVNDEARKRNGNLPGMGGVFNVVNLHTYHYAGNNPVRYTDPDGKSSIKYHTRQTNYKLSFENARNLKNNMLNNYAFPGKKAEVIDALSTAGGLIIGEIPGAGASGTGLGIYGLSEKLINDNNIKTIANINTVIENDGIAAKLKNNEYDIVVNEKETTSIVDALFFSSEKTTTEYNFSVQDREGNIIFNLGVFTGKIDNLDKVGEIILPQFRSGE